MISSLKTSRSSGRKTFLDPLHRNRVTRSAVALLLFSSHLFSSGCASQPRTFSQNISKATEELAIGEEINRQILSSFYLYTEPNVVGYVNQIGTALARHAERKDLDYRFTILYNDKIYATSAPGGYVYLTTGFLNFLDNEAELAAVIAHEVGELQYKDPKLSQSRKILEALTRGGAMVGPAFGEIGALAVLGLAMASAAAESRQLKPEERPLRADQRALEYMMKAGQDPQGLIDLQYKFLNAGPDVAPYFFDYYQSRPITPERFQSLQEEFSKLPLAGKSFTTHRKVYQEMTHAVREIYKH